MYLGGATLALAAAIFLLGRRIRTQLSGCSLAQFEAAYRSAGGQGADVPSRALAYLPDIRKAARAFDISVGLLMAIAHTESLFKPTAASKAGAVGLVQLMPLTAASMYGRLERAGNWPFSPLRQNNDPQVGRLESEGVAGHVDRTDPAQSAWMGAALLALLQKSRDLEHALAAYNAGGGRITQSTPESDWPGETKSYVRTVLERTRYWERFLKSCEFGL